MLTPEIITAAHDAGYVIWVWPNDRALETATAYADFLARGVDGLNINFPEDGVAAVEAFIGDDGPGDDQLRTWSGSVTERCGSNRSTSRPTYAI